METVQLQLIGKGELESIIMRCVSTVLKHHKPEDNAPKQAEGYISRAQVCNLLQISTPTLHRYINQGTIKSYHIGGRTLFKKSEVLTTVQPVENALKKKQAPL
jgi:excisionase family DNA binding protein